MFSSRESFQAAPDGVANFEPVIKVLLYFDIFHYPLKAEEIHQFLSQKMDLQEVKSVLKYLTRQSYLYQFNEFYSIDPNDRNMLRRLKGNEMASSLFPLAKRRAELIGSFPFVKCVMASGSFSKGYMDSESDLDFFIVTDPGRLWIARMLLVLYKRLFLGNSRKYFCVNYFVTSEGLEIQEKNQFTATELATVIPLYGNLYYRKLIEANGWIMRYFPNYVPQPWKTNPKTESVIKRLMEKFINLLGGNRLDDVCMRLTTRRWRRAYSEGYDRQDFLIAFKSNKNTSKHHPKNYQKKVIERLEQTWTDYANRFNLKSL